MMRSCSYSLVVVCVLLMGLLSDAWRVMPSSGRFVQQVQYKHVSAPATRGNAVCGLNRACLMKHYTLKGESIAVTNINDDGSDWLKDEALQHLRQEFLQLSGGKPNISFKTFMNWEEIQALIADELIQKEECVEIWKTHGNSLDNDIDLPTFIRVNQAIDDLFEEGDDEEVDAVEEVAGEVMEYEENSEEFEVAEDGSDRVDPWDEDIIPTEFFDKDYLKHVRDFFLENGQETPDEYTPSYLTTSKGFGSVKNSKKQEVFRRVLSFKKFLRWEDIESYEKDGSLDVTSIEEAWVEAVAYQKSKGVVVRGVQEEVVTWETFLRLMLRLDIMMEDIQTALETLTDEDVKTYYRECFGNLTKGKELLFLNELLEWDELKYLLDNNDITKEKVEEMWEILPKEAYTTRTSREFGIKVDSFIAFNEAIEEQILSIEVKSENYDEVADTMQ